MFHQHKTLYIIQFIVAIITYSCLNSLVISPQTPTIYSPMVSTVWLLVHPCTNRDFVYTIILFLLTTMILRDNWADRHQQDKEDGRHIDHPPFPASNCFTAQFSNRFFLAVLRHLNQKSKTNAQSSIPYHHFSKIH